MSGPPLPPMGPPSFYLGNNRRPVSEGAAEEEKARFGILRLLEMQRPKKHETIRMVEQGMDLSTFGLTSKGTE